MKFTRGENEFDTPECGERRIEAASVCVCAEQEKHQSGTTRPGCTSRAKVLKSTLELDRLCGCFCQTPATQVSQ